MIDWNRLQPWSAEPVFLQTVVGYIGGGAVRFGEMWAAAKHTQELEEQVVLLRLALIEADTLIDWLGIPPGFDSSDFKKEKDQIIRALAASGGQEAK